MSKTDEYECPLLECDVVAPDDNDKDALFFIKNHLQVDHTVGQKLFVTLCPIPDCNKVFGGASVDEVKADAQTHLSSHTESYSVSDTKVESMDE